MQGGLVLLAGILGLAVAWQTKDWRWTVGAGLMLLNGPYNLLGILPTNRLLNGVAIEQANSESRTMIVRWGRMHAVRTLLGLAATAAYIWALK
jgi:hypothetical protein